MMNTPYKLKTSKIYWDKKDDTIQEIIKSGIVLNNLSNDQIHLIKELDRRLFQLWHKVSYEREKNLIIYHPHFFWKKIITWFLKYLQ